MSKRQRTETRHYVAPSCSTSIYARKASHCMLWLVRLLPSSSRVHGIHHTRRCTLIYDPHSSDHRHLQSQSLGLGHLVAPSCSTSIYARKASHCMLWLVRLLPSSSRVHGIHHTRRCTLIYDPHSSDHRHLQSQSLGLGHLRERRTTAS